MRVLVYFKKEQKTDDIFHCGLTQNKEPEFVVKSILGWCYRIYIPCDEYVDVPSKLPTATRWTTETKHMSIDEYLATIPKPKPKKTEDEKKKASAKYWFLKHHKEKQRRANGE